MRPLGVFLAVLLTFSPMTNAEEPGTITGVEETKDPSIFFRTEVGFMVITPSWVPENRQKDVANLIDVMWGKFKKHWKLKREVTCDPKEITIMIHPNINWFMAWVRGKWLAVEGATSPRGKRIVVAWMPDRGNINPIGALFHEWCHLAFGKNTYSHNMPIGDNEKTFWQWADLSMYNGSPRMNGRRILKSGKKSH